MDNLGGHIMNRAHRKVRRRVWATSVNSSTAKMRLRIRNKLPDTKRPFLKESLKLDFNG